MKNKKGFTLIELLVVIAIIGVLALIGLRFYGDQQKKAKNVIVIANASTVHNLIQGDLLDHDYTASPSNDVLTNIGGNATPAATSLANMKNPYNASGNIAVVGTIGTGNVGEVIIDWVSQNMFKIQGIGDGGIATGEVLIAIR